jgi:hypothetical protein
MDLKNMPQEIVEETQKWMAEKIAELHQAMGVQLWIIGIAQLKDGGIFSTFMQTLKSAYTNQDFFIYKVLFFNHFSYGHFINTYKMSNSALEYLFRSEDEIEEEDEDAVYGYDELEDALDDNVVDYNAISYFYYDIPYSDEEDDEQVEFPNYYDTNPDVQLYLRMIAGVNAKEVFGIDWSIDGMWDDYCNSRDDE